MKKNFGFTLSEEAAAYVEWLFDSCQINRSAWVSRLIEEAAADDDRYQPGSEWVDAGCQYCGAHTEEAEEV